LVENISKDVKDRNYLNYPKDLIKVPEREDIHFVFEYNQGD